MNYFRDTVTGKVWAFDLDVVATNTEGVYSFQSAQGRALNAPATLQPCPNNTPPAAAAPTLAEQAQGAMAQLVAVTSAGTPDIAGSYPIAGPVWEDLKDEALFIQSFGVFSSGASSISFVLPGGKVTFAATATLQAVVKGLGMLLSNLKTIAAQGTGTLPTVPLTLELP